MGHHHEIDTVKGIQFAFWLNLCFSILEVIGGFYTNSTAILADAFHDFMDVIAIGLAVLLERYAKKQADHKYTFGYKRFSVLSAVIVSGILITGSIFMIKAAITSFGQPKELHATGMLLLAVLGIAANGLAFLRIKKEGQSLQHALIHEQGHGHGTGTHKKHHHANPNSQAIMLHLLEDVLSWIAVLIGAVVIYFTNWIWIDAVLTLGIASFILFNAIKNLCSTAKIFLQAAPQNLNITELEQLILQYPEVDNIMQLRIWTLDGMHNIASLKLNIKASSTTNNQLLARLKKTAQDFNINDITIQVESVTEDL